MYNRNDQTKPNLERMLEGNTGPLCDFVSYRCMSDFWPIKQKKLTPPRQLHLQPKKDSHTP